MIFANNFFNLLFPQTLFSAPTDGDAMADATADFEDDDDDESGEEHEE